MKKKIAIVGKVIRVVLEKTENHCIEIQLQEITTTITIQIRVSIIITQETKVHQKQLRFHQQATTTQSIHQD